MNPDERGTGSTSPPVLFQRRSSQASEWIAILILFFVNLINYMDRVTIAAVLHDVKSQYHLDDKQSGFLQTAFVISYMIFAPVFGYLGDRYSRKTLMALGVFFWSLTTLLGSIPPKDFSVFLLLRALVGTGEASYSTIAPTIIADLFPEGRRSVAIGFFYYAIPIGSGLGYMVGSNVAAALGGWYWALRVTPVLGAFAVFAIMFGLRDPPRGESDGGVQMAHSSVQEDLLDLWRNKSYIYSTLGFTAATFALGAMSWFAPTFVQRAQLVYNQGDKKLVDFEQINLIFGAITCFAGAMGITIAVVLAGYLRRYTQRGDPAICAVGVILGIPPIALAVMLADTVPVATWVLFFFGLTFLSLNWSAVPDMLLYTVVPNRRASASAIQILVSHALGDAASPYIVGALSDHLSNGNPDDYVNQYTSLRDAMYLPVVILVAGAGFFILNIFTIIRDRERCQMQMQANGRTIITDESLPDLIQVSSPNIDESLATQDTTRLIRPQSVVPLCDE